MEKPLKSYHPIENIVTIMNYWGKEKECSESQSLGFQDIISQQTDQLANLLLEN